MSENIMAAMPKIENRALKYGYSNVRARSMKGTLISESLLNEMIRVSGVDAVIELLQRTEYKEDIGSAAASYSGSRIVEFATSTNFSRVAQRLVKITPKDDCPAVEALLLKWDLNNLKAIMDAKKIGMSYEEVRPHLFRVGDMSDDDFKRILKADDRILLQEIRRTRLGKMLFTPLETPTGKQLQRAVKDSLRSVDAFFKEESLLDGFAYFMIDRTLSRLRGKEIAYLRRLIRKEIDIKNIMIIERLKRHNMPREQVLLRIIKGGTLRDSSLKAILDAKDLGAVIILVKNKFPRLELKDNMTLAEFEIALEQAIARQRNHAFHRNVLSVGVIIGFLLLKEEEINNLRKIAKGKEFGLTEDEIRQTLLVV